MQFLFYVPAFFTISFALARNGDLIEISEEDEKRAISALRNSDLYDGDIIGINGPFDSERNAIPATHFRWPNSKVPYVLDSSVEYLRDNFNSAIDHYHNTTCVKFVPRTHEKDYIMLFAGEGCYSNIGRTRGKQLVSLGEGCNYVGTIIHELGHSLGFYHEQSRSDRDDYVDIFIENVKLGTESNFWKLSKHQNILYNDFDHHSIMIYGNKAFSKNGKDTIKSKNHLKLWDPYWKHKMTESDISRVNKMYNCHS